MSIKHFGSIRVLSASDGKILTNGSIYGKKIFLSVNDLAENFYEIDEQEFLQKEQIALEAAQEALN